MGHPQPQPSLDPLAAPPKTRRRARQYERVNVRCGCWLEHEEATVFGTTVDLARGGIFLRTALPMTEGATVRVTLKLPGHAPVVAEGQIVRHVSTHDGHRPGLGVRFERLSAGDNALRAFLGATLAAEDELYRAG